MAKEFEIEKEKQKPEIEKPAGPNYEPNDDPAEGKPYTTPEHEVVGERK